jgi:hypothetical protein
MVLSLVCSRWIWHCYAEIYRSELIVISCKCIIWCTEWKHYQSTRIQLAASDTLVPVISAYHRHVMRSALFWGITQRRMVILCRRFGTRYRSHLQGSRSWLLKMGPTRCPETSAKDYHLTLRNAAEERTSHAGTCLPIHKNSHPKRT